MLYFSACEFMATNNTHSTSHMPSSECLGKKTLSVYIYVCVCACAFLSMHTPTAKHAISYMWTLNYSSIQYQGERSVSSPKS